MSAPRSVLVVGESLAGTTAARHLRTLGHIGPLTLIGAAEQGAYGTSTAVAYGLRKPVAALRALAATWLPPPSV
ncbi:hypothetical protein [Streptomyces sp. VNUA24]|uniref:hypothetical protein n=1 Tax=Streptomyces sp. VNUA24 TaxID=3031131 RepID=UPI0023B8714D|nr:hypothetical protein [Streptomyces sp. VNUA24]WEH13102.1 hypothetical protein PYR72_05065 [Streptomyces sp. VNUA24]